MSPWANLQSSISTQVFTQTLTCVVLMIFSHIVSANDKVIAKIAMLKDTYEVYELDKLNNVCEDLRLFKGRPNHRMMVDLSLICQAFKAANFDIQIALLIVPNYSRSLRDVSNGTMLMPAETIWKEDVQGNPNVFISQDIIRYGEFEKGLYTIVSHPLQKMALEDIDFTQYSAITFRNWRHDLQALLQVTPKVLTSIQYDSIVNMLAAGRADFSLIEFSGGKDFIFNHKGTLVKPVNGIKVRIMDARVFVMSKEVANSRMIFSALQTGLSKLRQANKIRPQYVTHGMINPQVANWKVANPKD